MKTKRVLSSLVFFLLSPLLPHPSIFAQGPLTPPAGTPAPTMKSLEQIEPRTPISSLPFSITQSGSYYLTGNLSVTGGSGITILADQVTVDLSGFAISSSASPAAGTAISISNTRRNITIRNGHLRGTTTFAAGAFTSGGFLDGIQSSSSLTANVRITEINVHGMGSDGINFATTAIPTAIVERCNVSICGDRGIIAGVVRDCSAETTGEAAITGDIVTNCYGETVGTASATAPGVSATSVVENSRGISVGGGGISAINVSNSRGVSTSGTGISASNVLNSEGVSTSGPAGILASTGTVSFSRGRRDGGSAISCFNAIGCSVSGTGTVSATNKSLGTP